MTPCLGCRPLAVNCLMLSGSMLMNGLMLRQRLCSILFIVGFRRNLRLENLAVHRKCDILWVRFSSVPRLGAILQSLV